MSATTTPESVSKTVKQPTRRPRHSVPLAPGSTRDAKRMAAVILEVFAGLRTPQQGAEALAMSLGGYYQLEARAMQGLLEACEPKPRGRQPNPERELTVILRENERSRRDLGRQQSLVRVAQRTIGLNPPAPPPKTTAKTSGKKTRQRKPVVRALSLATRLHQEAAAPAAASDNGLSPTPVG